MPDSFLSALDRLNHEAESLPVDETIVGTFASLNGQTARITLEPEDGRLLVAEIPANELSDLGIKVGQRFLLSPRSKPRLRPFAASQTSQEELKALAMQIRSELEGLEI